MIAGMQAGAQRGRARGFGQLELLGVLALGAVLAAGIVMAGERDWELARARQSATRHALVADAVSRTLQARRADLAGLVPLGAVSVLSWSDLVGAGQLSPALAQVDGYGRRSCVLLVRDGDGVDALVAQTGGTPSAEAAAVQQATLAGPGAGYVLAGQPLRARGAFGTWTLDAAALQRFAGASCPGGALAAGDLVTPLHLASPGDADTHPAFIARHGGAVDAPWNVLDTPLALGGGATVAEGADCGTAAAIGIDAGRKLMTCDASGKWRRQSAAGTWKESRPGYASLPAGDAPGDVRLAADVGRAFVARAGGGWQALAVDQDGNLAVPGRVDADTARVDNRLDVGDTAAATGNVKVQRDIAVDDAVHATHAVRANNLEASGWAITGTKHFVLWKKTAVPGEPCNLPGQQVTPDGKVGILYPVGTMLSDANGITLSCQSPGNVFRYLNGKLTP